MRGITSRARHIFFGTHHPWASHRSRVYFGSHLPPPLRPPDRDSMGERRGVGGLPISAAHFFSGACSLLALSSRMVDRRPTAGPTPITWRRSFDRAVSYNKNVWDRPAWRLASAQSNPDLRDGWGVALFFLVSLAIAIHLVRFFFGQRRQFFLATLL